jgi:hypothetical protein
MGQKISAPVAIAVVVIVVGGLSFFLYKHYMGGGATGDKPIAFNTTQAKPMQPPHTKEEGLAFYKNSIGGKK